MPAQRRAEIAADAAATPISDDFQFGARLIKRSVLKNGVTGWIELAWDEMITGAGALALEVHRNLPIPR